MGSRVAPTIELPSIGCDPVAPGKVGDVNNDDDSILVEVETLVRDWLNLSEAANEIGRASCRERVCNGV